MLCELQEQALRIEHLANAQQEVLQDVHPAVEQIQSDVQDVATAVSEQTRAADRA